MPLKSKTLARPASKQTPPLALPLKPGVRATNKAAHEDPDPLGLFPTLSEQLKQTYDAQVRAFLRKFLLVGGLPPAVRQSIFAAVTARGRPSASTSGSPSIPAMLQYLSCGRRADHASRRTRP